MHKEGDIEKNVKNLIKRFHVGIFKSIRNDTQFLPFLILSAVILTITKILQKNSSGQCAQDEPTF